VKRIWASRYELAGAVVLVILMYKFVDKQHLMYVISQSLPPRESGLLNGIIFGEKSGFEKSFYEYLKNSGLVHLVVVSGSNVMLLVGGLIELIAGFLGRKKTIITGLTIGFGYAAMVNWEIPVVRAIILLSIYYWAQLLGRKYDLGRGLGLAILIMVLGEATVLKSVSFWLSITAFLGVVTYRGKNEFWKTIWVSVWITPILAMIFGKISLISPITNVLVIGMIEVVTIIGIIGAGIGLIIPILGKLVLWMSYPMLNYLGAVAEFGGSLKWATVEMKFNWWMLIGWYLILFYYVKSKNNSDH
jgi:competence protein ComEC